MSLVLKGCPPRSPTINRYLYRIWYKSQPLVCNLYGVQDHKSSACPNRDKCRRYGQSGHSARACPRTFEDRGEDENRVSVIVARASGVDAPLSSSGDNSGENCMSLSSSDSTSAIDHDIDATDDSVDSVGGVPPSPCCGGHFKPRY